MKKIILLGVLVFILTACGALKTAGEATPAPTPANVVAEIPAPITDANRLKICLVGEPNSIYMYDPLNLVGQKTLSIIYDGMVPGQPRLFKSSVLEELPKFENGSAKVVPIEVRQGDMVVTAERVAKKLESGDHVLPSGCRDLTCAVGFSGEPLIMDQVMIDFRFLPDLRWSDGKPLTAADSIFSYTLAKQASAPAIRDLIDRTSAYELVSEDTTQWWGVPGYLSVEPSAVFFPPFPQHLRNSDLITDLEKNAMADNLLVGWGAYKFDHWVNSEMIFTPNPFYYDPNTTQPQFKELIIKYLPSTDAVYEDFMAGGCDVVDPSSGFEKFTPILTDQNANGAINLQITRSPLIETLMYNIREDHESGTEGINPLANPLVRAAINNCVNRYALVNYDLRGYPVITDSFVAPYNLPEDNDWTTFTRSTLESKEYFEKSGWTDDDKNPTTPRIAKNIPGVENGTELNLVFTVVNTPLRVSIANAITTMLADCGVSVETHIVETKNYFEESAAGTLASGAFDIAQFAFGSYEVDPPCQVFSAREIPHPGNSYQGVNFTSYNNPDYNLACSNALLNRVEQSAWLNWLRSAHEILLVDSPALPLFHQYQVTAAGSDICLPEPDMYDPLGYANIALITRNADCAPSP